MRFVGPAIWYFLRYYWLIAIVLGLTTIYMGYRLRLEWIKKQEQQHLQLAQYRQEAMENKLAVLRLQMNPHFIFNSLNAVGSFILDEEPLVAYRYLHRFAQLMRKILDVAAKSEISLEEEIELLSAYLETEAIRLDHKFCWKVKIQAGMDSANTMIPTMMLQPFLENAIWHGIMAKENQGEIKVLFVEDVDYLICIIEDDGVGREASRYQTNKHRHESKAMKIVEDRLRLLAQHSSKKPELDIIDLKGEDHAPKGTRVEIKLPKTN